ncbi:hypothetical protein Mapa_017765 [Marchantia paleacea]|nr:hypothetical protein Mapa_017765 [Marchantia paleacea]
MIKRLNDAVYEFYRPPKGSIDLRVIFFHGFQEEDCNDAYLKTWMKADESESWLNTWLAEAFPQANIISVSYDSSRNVSQSGGRLGMYAVGESLARSIVELEGSGENCPVVLVGYCVGGLVLKEVCLKIGDLGKVEQGLNRYVNFLKMMRGVFFFSTAHSGSLEGAESYGGAPLVEYLEVLSEKAARINAEFSALRHQHGWTTLGVCEANEAPSLETRGKRVVVGEASARHDMDKFTMISGADHDTICKPEDKQSSSYMFLVNFLRQVCHEEEKQKLQLRLSLDLPQILLPTQKRFVGVIEKLQLRNLEPLRLALVGMNGIGKTTLAKQVLMHIAPRFQYVCFVPDTKQSIKQESLLTLVAKNLFQGNGRRVDSQDDHTVWWFLKGKKSLLILDDTDTEDQIRRLLEPNWLGDGSRLLITSRIQTEVPGFVMHEVPLLSEQESRQLFDEYVCKSMPRTMPEELVKRIVDKCDCLPLTLRNVGRYLRSETEEEKFIEALERLQNAESLDGIADDKYWQKLGESYEELGKLEKTMFLDLAVFDVYSGEKQQYDVDLLKQAWRTRSQGMSPDIGLKNLQERSLIRMRQFSGSLNTHRIVHIHEQLRDLGKSKSRPVDQSPELCRGIWHTDDVIHVLTKYKGETAKIEVLTVDGGNGSDSSCSEAGLLHADWSSIGKMSHLRFLRMANVNFGGSPRFSWSHVCPSTDTQKFPASLVMLHMINCSEILRSRWPLFDIKSCWPLCKKDVATLRGLVILLLENCGCVNLPDNFHTLIKLKTLQIHENLLERLPDKFGLLPVLKHMSLQSQRLEKLPNSFLQLSSLKSLTIDGCLAVKVWPIPDSSSAVERCKLTSLDTLILHNLPALAKLPESFREIAGLRNLHLIACSDLKKLPEGFSELQKLKNLEIRGCCKLESLCESFSRLSCLESLILDDLPALKALPETCGRLSSLGYLKVTKCPSLKKLPEGLGNIHELDEVEIGLCHGLLSVCHNFGEFGAKKISFNSCDSLRRLPDSFGNVGELILKYNQQLEILPEIGGQLTSLKHLDITACDRTEGLLQSLGELTNLQDLNLTFGERFKGLPRSFGHLPLLKKLYVRNCTFPAGFSDSLGQLTSLESLHLYNCSNFTDLAESFRHLTRLEKLVISDCENFMRLPESSGQLTGLNTLVIEGCQEFKGLPESIIDLVSVGKLSVHCKN